MTKARKVRVLVVDDHAVVRSGLRLLLESEKDIEVVGEAGDVREAVLEARSTHPDVVLMDVVMPDMSGIEGIPRVLAEAPETKVLFLSMQDDPRYVREAFEAGAAGYVLKEAADTELVAAVREVAGATCTRSSVRDWRWRRWRSSHAQRQILSRTANARCYACSPSVTRTTRSRRCCSSPSARPRRTGRTSCRS